MADDTKSYTVSPFGKLRLITDKRISEGWKMRYTYKGDKWTDAALRGLQCDPVRDGRGKCVISQGMATALVIDSNGQKQVVLRRLLRVNEGER